MAGEMATDAAPVAIVQRAPKTERLAHTVDGTTLVKWRSCRIIEPGGRLPNRTRTPAAAVWLKAEDRARHLVGASHRVLAGDRGREADPEGDRLHLDVVTGGHVVSAQDLNQRVAHVIAPEEGSRFRWPPAD